MNTLTNQAGLSLTENKIQLVEVLYKEGSFCLENVDEEYFEESISLDTKEAKFIHILQNAFNEIVLRKPLTSTRISIALPPWYFKIFELPIDKNLTKNDVNEYIKWELGKLFPLKKNTEFTFQKVVLNTPTYESYKKIIVYAIEIDILKRIHKFCVRNNLKLELIDNAHIASTSLTNNQDSSSYIISVYVENNQISILLFSDSNLISQSTFNYESVNEISDIIKGYLDEIKSSNTVSDEIKSIRLMGNSITPELFKDIESKTEYNTIQISPFEKLKISDNLKDNKFISDHSLKFTPATAISLRINS